MRLWIDDVRDPPDETWLWARSSERAIEILNHHSIEFVSYDYDLGGEDTTYPVVIFIENRTYLGKPPPGWAIHSQNPVGRARLRAALVNIETLWRNHVRQKNSQRA